MRGRKPLSVISSMRTSTFIKKESPNEGTETLASSVNANAATNKKRIPEWGDGNECFGVLPVILHQYKKRIPEWGDGNSDCFPRYYFKYYANKKRIPEWGDGNLIIIKRDVLSIHTIKKESPNEGTETRTAESCKLLRLRGIKKESPNEGTETYFAHLGFFGIHPDKKRIPE